MVLEFHTAYIVVTVCRDSVKSQFQYQMSWIFLEIKDSCFIVSFILMPCAFKAFKSQSISYKIQPIKEQITFQDIFAHGLCFVLFCFLVGWCCLVLPISHYTPSTTKLLWGWYIGFTTSVRPSVRPSVRSSWGLVTHTCIGELGRVGHQAIIWTNADICWLLPKVHISIKFYFEIQRFSLI